MKSKLKFKNLFIVVILSLVAFLPLFNNSIKVNANTEILPTYELEEGFISIDNQWYLLIRKTGSEFRNSVNNSITVYNSSKGVYKTVQVNSVVNWWLNNYGEIDNYFYFLDYPYYVYYYGLPDLPNFEHYAETYYLIDMYKWAYQVEGYIINNEIIKVAIRTNDTNTLVWDKTFNSNKHNLEYFANKLSYYYYDLNNEGTFYNEAYNKGFIDGKAEAFNNYDRLLPNVLGSTLMFFTSIFGSINFFGISLLSIIGIIGGILLLLFVLKIVRG